MPLAIVHTEEMENNMADNATFYEEAREQGEVVVKGMRYRIFFDPNRGCTIFVLVPGQALCNCPTVGC